MSSEAWTFYYKCRMCGEEFSYNGGHQDDVFNGMFDILSDDKVEYKDVQVRRLGLHDCDDDRTGIADLIGCKRGEPS